MKRKLHAACMDCGSEAQHVTVDEVKPVYREEVIHYACGAVLRSMSASRGQKARVSHEGCGDGFAGIQANSI
jgi:hypothetical protein